METRCNRKLLLIGIQRVRRNSQYFSRAADWGCRAINECKFVASENERAHRADRQYERESREWKSGGKQNAFGRERCDWRVTLFIVSAAVSLAITRYHDVCRSKLRLSSDICSAAPSFLSFISAGLAAIHRYSLNFHLKHMCHFTCVICTWHFSHLHVSFPR